MDLQLVINEIHRKIGRNLLLIQNMEYLLKYIVLNSKVSGQSSQIINIKKTFEEKLSKQSMGQVLSQYLDHIHPLAEKNHKNPNFENDPLHLSFETEYNLSKEEFEKKENLLSDILEERNNLVHHFILDFNENSIDSCKDMGNKLDEQRNRILPELEYLQKTVQLIEEFHNKLRKFIESGKFEKELFDIIKK